jgi:glycosyltransferase involved in cell wall biosynthesis
MTHVLINAINDNAQPRGPDRYLLELLPALVAADPGLRLTVLHAPWQAAFATHRGNPNTVFRCMDAPRNPVPRLIWQATSFVRHANRMAPDVVFLPNLIWTPGLRAPSVMTVHDLLHFSHPAKFGRMKAMLLRQVIRRAIARSEALISVSQATREVMTRVAPAAVARTRVIPEGGPPAMPARDTPRERMFLYVGKIERTKNVPLLAESFLGSDMLRDRGYRLVIVGPDGNDSAALAPLVAGSAGRVQRPGYVDDETLETLYATARGFVFPSEAEGFGLVILEAMARGAPVIAADATSLPEVIGDAGLLVPPGDLGALRQAMERLASDDALQDTLSAAGYARLARFSWAGAGRETADVLNRVVRP